MPQRRRKKRSAILSCCFVVQSTLSWVSDRFSFAHFAKQHSQNFPRERNQPERELCLCNFASSLKRFFSFSQSFTFSACTLAFSVALANFLRFRFFIFQFISLFGEKSRRSPRKTIILFLELIFFGDFFSVGRRRKKNYWKSPD